VVRIMTVDFDSKDFKEFVKKDILRDIEIAKDIYTDSFEGFMPLSDPRFNKYHVKNIIELAKLVEKKML